MAMAAPRLKPTMRTPAEYLDSRSSGDNLLHEYGHSLPIADGHLGILFVSMHGSHHAWNTV